MELSLPDNPNPDFKKYIKRRGILLIKTGILLILLIVLIFYCASLERSIMWPGVSGNYSPGPDAKVQVEWLQTDGGRVEMWFIPASDTRSSQKTTVIIAHGNGESIDRAYAAMHPYLDMGVNLALCEYRGYGRSEGIPSQESILFDFTRCYDWIFKKDEVDSSRIFFHGTSIGTGVVCALAQKRKPSALILVSPLINTRMLAKEKFPVLYPVFRLFFSIKNPFDNEAFLEKSALPALILHGKQDRVIPFSHGRHLHRISPNSRLIALNCGHNDMLAHPNNFWPGVQRFLAENDFIRSD